jgi:phosphoglycerol transferase MdoB-like AlkP superfamily enzyme
MTLSVYAPMMWREYTRDNPKMKGTALSQELHDHKYRTAFIASLDWTYADGDKFLQDRGFDHIWDYNDLDGGQKIGFWGVDDSKLIDRSLQWVKEDPSRPFFLMCWNQGTHSPYDWNDTCNSVWDDYIKLYNGNNRGVYGAMWWDLIRYLNSLRHLDEQLGRLLQGLKDAGLADDTLVVFIGDHGECFGEPHYSYGHAGDLYQEGINIPCIFWNPSLFRSQPRSLTLGHTNDIPATILDILGISAPPGWQGRSLLSPQHAPRVYFYGPRDYYMLGLRQRDQGRDLKYICNTLSADRGDELYDLAVDPDEQVNIAAKNPQLVHRFRQRLAAWLAYEMDHYRP